MKSIFSLIMLPLMVSATAVKAQTKGITSGAVYTLKSNGQLLDVTNASMDNGAGVDTWTDTKSDAQRWKVTHLGNSVYTLTNMGSGKLLHLRTTSADAGAVDQSDDESSEQVKWKIRKGGSAYYLTPVAQPEGSLNASGNGNIVRVDAGAHKWIFSKEASGAPTPIAVAAAKTFDAWYTQYGIDTSRGFWDKAEMMEIVLDAYEVTKDTVYASRFNRLYEHFIAANKADWMYNKYNDDIAWAVLFCVRGYLLTGNKTYLEKAKEQFDKMYARAFTNKYGGGLNWYETKTSKNACIQGPAMVACCYLAQATGDSTYYDKAIALYSWSKIYLFNPATGKVNDNIALDKATGLVRTGTWSSTYNQGTYLGAAVMLYQHTKEANYLVEAEKIARYTRDSMYNGKTMNNEDGGNDLPGFKGIFARYARKYTVVTGKTDLVDWLHLNARVAFNNRNSQGLIQTKWATRTSEIKPKSAFGASTAVSLLVNLIPLSE